MNDNISIPLQLQLLTLLCYSSSSAPLIRNAISPNMFAAAGQRRLAERVYSYLDTFHRPPQTHTADLLEELAEGGTDRGTTPEAYAEIAEHIADLRANVDEDFVLSQLNTFVSEQALRTGIVRASEAVQAGNLTEAKAALNTALRTQISAFTPGLRLVEGLDRLNEETRIGLLPWGIKPLDDAQLGPARGELSLMIAPPKRGKTWSLIHIGKQALLRRLNVVHITLEISERLIVQRYLQSLFSIQRSKAQVNLTRLRLDSLGRVELLEREIARNVPAFRDDGARKLLSSKLQRFNAKDRLVVKAFPTGGLTIPELRNYLDLLERALHFIPDVLIIDYPDLMKLGTDNYRLELGAIFKDLRGIAVERNLICVAATQSNRTGSTAKLLTDAHTAEDYSKIATADTVLTYSQTSTERELGLARIYASNTRVGEDDRFVTLITQAYRIGQFALDAALLPSAYDTHLDALIGRSNRATQEDDDNAQENSQAA